MGMQKLFGQIGKSLSEGGGILGFCAILRETTKGNRTCIRRRVSEFSPSSIGFSGPATEFSLIVLFWLFHSFSHHISYFSALLKVLRRVSGCPPTHLPVSYPEYRLNVHRHLPLESEERDSRFSAAEYLHAWFCGRPRRHQVSMPNPARQQP